MAIAYSFTDQKILDLIEGLESIGLSQDQIRSTLTQLSTQQESLVGRQDQFENVDLPSMQAAVNGASIQMSDLVNTVLPDLESSLSQAELDLENLTNVDIPAIQQGLENELINASLRTKTFFQDEEPPAYDDLEERDLIPGDVWYDTDNENLQHLWNGVSWTTLSADIPNLEEAILANLAPEHTIFENAVSGAVVVSNGANITPTP